MSKFLVTGGAGFIGSHLVEALLARGDDVCVLDNFSSGKMENLAGIQKKIHVIHGDLRDQNDLERAVAGVDFIFHQAAFVSVPLSLEKPDTCFEVNVTGTHQLLLAARAAGVKRVVMASSAAVYGENPAVPLSEKELADPRSPYAASKRIGEIYSQIFTRQLGLDVVALRYFNVFGPRQNPLSDYAAVIPIFIRTLLEEGQPVVFGDGFQSRDFIYIADVVRANLLAAESSLSPGHIINVCAGQETDLLTLIDLLSDIFSREIRPEFQHARPGDLYRSLGNPSLARELINFKPKVNLEDGLRKTVDWMRKS